MPALSNSWEAILFSNPVLFLFAISTAQFYLLQHGNIIPAYYYPHFLFCDLFSFSYSGLTLLSDYPIPILSQALI